ncbi:MAG: hypothetical protein IKF83_03075, partial [Clostridia bacterium]|nr:hypothetical protein [Clostridia bacterium]
RGCVNGDGLKGKRSMGTGLCQWGRAKRKKVNGDGVVSIKPVPIDLFPFSPSPLTASLKVLPY